MPENTFGKKTYNGFLGVVTGDVIGSSKLRKDALADLEQVLRKIYAETTKHLDCDLPEQSFAVFRGDSFQYVLDKPGKALRTAIMFSCLAKCQNVDGNSDGLDVRQSLGVGPGWFDRSQNWTNGHGEAYEISGHGLDGMGSRDRLKAWIRGPQANSAEEEMVEVLNTLLSKWSRKQCQAIAGVLAGKTQKEIAEEIGITQPAVSYRLDAARKDLTLALVRPFEDKWQTV